MSIHGIKPENYYLDVLQNPDYYITGEKPTYNKVIKEAYSREQVLNLPQPQLTIPKSIAEKIDKFIKVLHFLNEFEAIKFLSAMDLNDDRTPQWLKDNPMLVFAYLAGKALGVDLVKVGEG